MAKNFYLRDVERELIIIEDFEKTVCKLELDREALLETPYAFVDRNGDYKAPFAVGENLAKIFCLRYPEQILRAISLKEAKWHKEVLEIAEPLRQQALNSFYDQYRAAFSLIRERCGKEKAAEINHINILRNEIRRLRKMVESTADWLKSSGHHVKAKNLLKQLNEHDPYDTGS